MNDQIRTIWVYLAQTPLLWLTLTLVIYQAAFWLYRRCGEAPLCNPVLMAVALLVALLTGTGTPYQTYFDGAQFVHFLLGPATVALAIPLYLHTAKLRRMLLPVLGTLVVGATVAVLSTLWIGELLHVSPVVLRSMLPKSVTTPIAMGIAEQIGGLPSLTAALVILTGIGGAVIAAPLLDWLRVYDAAGRGFAIGIASHGIGTARAFQMNEETGAFAGLAMGLNGAMTTMLLPVLVWLFGP